MHLFLDSYGAFLGIKDGLFRVKAPQAPERCFPSRRIKAIFIGKGIRISSNALLLALEEEIPVLFLDALGRPKGQVWSGYYGSIAELRRKQVYFMSQTQALYWGREVLLTKIEKQIQFIEKQQQAQPDLQLQIALVQKIKSQFQNWTLTKQTNIADTTATFRGWEGTASRIYFQALSAALPLPFQFNVRSRRPALDPFNALLNYLYGILYGLVELELMKVGLDPFVGVLHTDRHRRPCLVFDCIELYRHWAEELALQLCLQHTVSAEDDFDPPTQDQGYFLSHRGKEKIVPAFFEFLNEKINKPSDNGQHKRLSQMNYDAQQLANFIKSIDL